MKHLIGLALLALLLVACQSSNGSSAATEFTRPDFIDFDFIETQADLPGRKMAAYQAEVSLQTVGDEEIVILTKNLETSENAAFVLQQEIVDPDLKRDWSHAWVVFLQDHLLIFSEDGSERLRLSVQDRPLDSPAIGESASFTETIRGLGLARYYGRQPVTVEDLDGAASYLDARSRTGE